MSKPSNKPVKVVLVVMAVAILAILLLGAGRRGGHGDNAQQGASCSAKDVEVLVDQLLGRPLECATEVAKGVTGGEGTYLTAVWTYTQGSFQSSIDPAPLSDGQQYNVHSFTEAPAKTYTLKVKSGGGSVEHEQDFQVGEAAILRIDYLNQAGTETIAVYDDDIPVFEVEY